MSLTLKRLQKRLTCRVLQKTNAKLGERYLQCLNKQGVPLLSKTETAVVPSSLLDRSEKVCNKRPIGLVLKKINPLTDKVCTGVPQMRRSRRIKERIKGWL